MSNTFHSIASKGIALFDHTTGPALSLANDSQGDMTEV